MWQKLKNIYHLFVAVSANVWFGFPGKKLVVIGITGTDGKTTTVNLIYHILKSAGKDVSMISTVGAMIHGNSFPLGFHVTNPSSIPLQKFLSQAAAGYQKSYLVLEVTSHGLDQNRVWGIPFAITGITNVTHEHLDYHKTYANYVKTKAKLLKKSPITFINKDDSSFELLQKELTLHKNVRTYALTGNTDINENSFTIKSKLIGKYNMYNTLLAAGICKQLGISTKEIEKGIATFAPPIGRGEVVHDDVFTVMIDFAHTPNAFAKILPEIKAKTAGKLIHVFGTAGERDKEKRPKMGKEAGTFDDVIILTSEDPRSEDPRNIIADLKRGIASNSQVYDIVDRKQAIKKAISLARKGDTVLLTGKAHETSMNYGHGEKPWSEYEAVEEALHEVHAKPFKGQSKKK